MFLTPGKLYKTNKAVFVAFYNKTQKDFIVIHGNDVFLYLNHEPYEDGNKKCIHFNIIFKDKFLHVEKPTLEWFLKQIKLP
jgi:hypothetical protein